MKEETQIICLSSNFPNHNQDCEVQCAECKRFQYNMEHPKKISQEELDEMEKNYNAIMKKSKL